MNDNLLKNYTSGDPEFDKWFRETQPDWANEIDAQLEKDSKFEQMRELLTEWLDNGRFLSGNSPEKTDLVNRTRQALSRTK